jgi:hypothetical protein
MVTAKKSRGSTTAMKRAQNARLGMTTDAAGPREPAIREAQCPAQEWQRDGRGLWAKRICIDDRGHTTGHNYTAWRYNVTPGLDALRPEEPPPQETNAADFLANIPVVTDPSVLEALADVRPEAPPPLAEGEYVVATVKRDGSEEPKYTQAEVASLRAQLTQQQELTHKAEQKALHLGQELAQKQCVQCAGRIDPEKLRCLECDERDAYLDAELEELRVQLTEAQQQAKTYHRRAQQAESACVKAGEAGGPSMGRALANAGYRHWQERAETAEQALTEAQQHEEHEYVLREEWRMRAESAEKALTEAQQELIEFDHIADKAAGWEEEYRKAAKALTEAQQASDKAHARAIAAEHHKSLSLLGRSSYAEVVEDKLRTQLAETELRAEAAEATLASLRQLSAKWREVAAMPQTNVSAQYWLRDNAAALDAALAGAGPTPPPSGWQPIETAPKDGTELLLTDGRYKRTGYWARRIEAWSVDMVPPVRMPTHWMPLPEGPTHPQEPT